MEKKKKTLLGSIHPRILKDLKDAFHSAANVYSCYPYREVRVDLTA